MPQLLYPYYFRSLLLLCYLFTVLYICLPILYVLATFSIRLETFIRRSLLLCNYTVYVLHI